MNQYNHHHHVITKFMCCSAGTTMCWDEVWYVRLCPAVLSVLVKVSVSEILLPVSAGVRYCFTATPKLRHVTRRGDGTETAVLPLSPPLPSTNSLGQASTAMVVVTAAIQDSEILPV